MKIKALAAALVLSVSAAASVHGFGLGAQANMSAGDIFAPGVALLVSPSDRVNLAFNWYFGPDDEDIIGLTLDAQAVRYPFTDLGAGTLNFTLGIGLFANAVFSDDDTGFDAGLRVPVGLSLMLFRDGLEIFFHVAPSFGIHLLPSFGTSDPFFPFALGIRLWFR